MTTSTPVCVCQYFKGTVIWTVIWRIKAVQVGFMPQGFREFQMSWQFLNDFVLIKKLQGRTPLKTKVMEKQNTSLI